jgi:hypothetical protein
LGFFLLQHVDAVITTIIGLFSTALAYKRSTSGSGAKSTKILRILGPCVIAFGLLRFGIDGAPAPHWQRTATSDNIASAEFPSAPESNDKVQELQGQTIHISGWACSVPAKDIYLQLSFSDVPIEETKVPPAERFEGMKKFFTSQGLEILGEGTRDFGGASGYILNLQQEGGKARMWARIAFVGSRIYRVVASSGAAYHEDPSIERFVDSFQIAGKEK